MSARAFDPLALPDWAVEVMLDRGFTLQELTRTPPPIQIATIIQFPKSAVARARRQRLMLRCALNEVVRR